uniref:HAT C-terminal dimerisation domain-containing protein n=1 Tax=Lactuca sativa TaxID=4236 RepID=A0A9R1W382_LACSA|nr:hypothetical protein LSAT_V11C300147210 [Lactuca sativa]
MNGKRSKIDGKKRTVLIVARMTKDIFSIQVTTMVSESTFNTCDVYRTRLNTPIFEELVCTQDWVRKSRKAIIDDDEDIFKDDDIVLDIHYVLVLIHTD